MARTKAAKAAETDDDATTWPAYRVERKPLEWLKPYPQNARTHSPEQVEQLRGSLKAYGWTIPALAREDGTIIAGHGRVEAGKLEGMTEVPVIVATGWSEEQCRSYALADNQITLNSAWDRELLALEVQDLSTMGVDLYTLGFEPVELQTLLEGPDPKLPAKLDERSSVIQFNIVFDDVGQQEQWFGFVRSLKATYPDAETLGERISLFLVDHGAVE